LPGPGCIIFHFGSKRPEHTSVCPEFYNSLNHLGSVFGIRNHIANILLNGQVCSNACKNSPPKKPLLFGWFWHITRAIGYGGKFQSHYWWVGLLHYCFYVLLIYGYSGFKENEDFENFLSIRLEGMQVAFYPLFLNAYR